MKIHPRMAAAAMTGAMTIVTAACGSTSAGAPTVTLTPGANTASASPTAAPATSTPAPANPGGGGGGQAQGPGRCHTNMLAALVTMGSPGAGQRYAFLVLTNASGITCLLFGFPGMELQTAALTPIPTQVIRGPATPHLVTLAPGKAAYSLLHWTVVPATDETGTPCEPAPAALIVTPPDEVPTLTTPWPGDSVCQHGQIDVSPFKLGNGS